MTELGGGTERQPRLWKSEREFIQSLLEPVQHILGLFQCAKIADIGWLLRCQNGPTMQKTLQLQLLLNGKMPAFDEWFEQRRLRFAQWRGERAELLQYCIDESDLMVDQLGNLPGVDLFCG